MKRRANKQAAATIKDVAKEAAVSAMTVSRVLNGESNVRPATKERVLEAIKALNYRPNVSARSLATARSYFIGLLYDNPSAGYLSELLIGALERCRQGGYHLVLENCGATQEAWMRAVADVLASSNFDGVIMPPPVCEFPGVIDALEAHGLPYVRIAPDNRDTQAPYVCVDDFEAARQMTNYLIELGHKNIGFIKGHPDHSAARLRFDGYCAALKAHALTMNPHHVEQGMFTFRSGLECAERLLGRETPPTAIFAANDDMAAAVIAMANKHHLSVPDDVSVVGFDDTNTALTVWPPLTTVRQPISDMAAAAVELLAEALRSTEGSGQIYRKFDCEIIVRESAAAPRQA